MARDRQTVVDDAVAMFEGIGSSEVGRHVIVALNKQVLKSRDQMRQSMRDVMSKGISGPGALYARGAPTAYMVNAVQCTQIAFRDGMDGAEVSVYVNAKQGAKGKDQSAVLKYYFGDAPNERPAGDVGMANDAVVIPQVEALVLTQHMDGMMVGGPQRGGLLRFLERRATPTGISRADVGRELAYASAGARERAALERGRASVYDRARAASEGYERIALRRRLEAAARAGATMRSAMGAHAKRRDLEELYEWGVFKGKDKSSGLPAFFARPRRMRDPAGGYHTFVRRDGTVSRMPDTIDVSAEYGVAGKASGPVALTRARHSVINVPVLQEPWRRMAETSGDTLYDTLQDELQHAVARKAAGRSF